MSDRVAQFLQRAESTAWAAGEAPALPDVVGRGAALRRRRQVGAIATGLAVLVVAGGVTATFTGGPRVDLLEPDQSTATATAPGPGPSSRARATSGPTAPPQPQPSGGAADAGAPPLPSPVPTPTGVPADGFLAPADLGPDWVVGTVSGDDRLTPTVDSVDLLPCPATNMVPVKASIRGQVYRRVTAAQNPPGQPGTQWLLSVRVADLTPSQLSAVRAVLETTADCDPAEGLGHVQVARTATMLVTAKPEGGGYTFGKGWVLAGNRFVFLDFLPDMISPAQAPPQWMVEATRTAALRASGTMPDPVTATPPTPASPAPSSSPAAGSPTASSPAVSSTPTARPGFLTPADLNAAGGAGWRVGEYEDDYREDRESTAIAGCDGSAALVVAGLVRVQAYRQGEAADAFGPEGMLFGTQTVQDVTAAQESQIRGLLSTASGCSTVVGPWVVTQQGSEASGYVALLGTALVDHRLVQVWMTASAHAEDGTPHRATLPGGLPWFRQVLGAAQRRIVALPG